MEEQHQQQLEAPMPTAPSSSSQQQFLVTTTTTTSSTDAAIPPSSSLTTNATAPTKPPRKRKTAATAAAALSTSSGDAPAAKPRAKRATTAASAKGANSNNNKRTLNAAASCEVMNTKKEAVTTAGAAAVSETTANNSKDVAFVTRVVRDWFLENNKPCTTQSLVDALGSKYSKTVVQRVLDDLAGIAAATTSSTTKSEQQQEEEGNAAAPSSQQHQQEAATTALSSSPSSSSPSFLVFKDFKKVRLYYPNQVTNFTTLSHEQLVNGQHRCKDLGAAVMQLEAQHRQQLAKHAAVAAAPSVDEATKRKAALECRVASLRQRIDQAKNTGDNQASSSSSATTATSSSSLTSSNVLRGGNNKANHLVIIRKRPSSSSSTSSHQFSAPNVSAMSMQDLCRKHFALRGQCARMRNKLHDVLAYVSGDRMHSEVAEELGLCDICAVTRALEDAVPPIPPKWRQ